MKKETMKIEALVSVTQFLIPREVIEVVNPAQEKKTTIHSRQLQGFEPHHAKG